MTFFDWTPNDESAGVVDVSEPGAWRALVDRYTDGRGNRALDRIVEIASAHGVQSVLVERRYIDLDWRSEHAQFYSTTFVRYPSVAHRLHFFAAPPPPDLGDLSGLQDSYVGYSIMRPLPSQPVGRTMIQPPPELRDAVRCEGTETIDLLGWPMTVTAMPFVSQDAQYLRCAHADLWMTFYLAHLAQGLARRLPAEIHDATMGGVIAARQVPSEGLSIQQMLAGMTKLGLSPGLLPLPETPEASESAGLLSLFGIVCRYVNSNLPPIIASNNHVWLVVAYTREPSGAHSRLTLYRHDDASGPYLPVDDPWQEPETQHRPWQQALLPLPPKIYMTAERAEMIGRWWFELKMNSTPPDVLTTTAAAGDLTYQLYGIKSSKFKQELVRRQGLDADVARAYRMSLWPRNIWVLEATDRSRRDAGQPAVMGEVIIDPTANHYPGPQETGILAAHSPGFYWSLSPDHRTPTSFVPAGVHYDTGRPHH